MRLERDKRYIVETDDTTKVVRFNDFQGVEQSQSASLDLAQPSLLVGNPQES